MEMKLTRRTVVGNVMHSDDDLVEMYVKFWEPYAVQVAAKGIDAIERVPAWLPKINGMSVEQLSPYEMLLHRVPRARVLDIKRTIKARVIDELGWREEPSHVVGIGIVADQPPEYPYAMLPYFFRKPRCMYTEKTPGYVRLGDGMPIAVLTDGACLGGKVLLYLHGNDEDIFDSREKLKPFMPPTCNLALVAYRGYGLSFGGASESGCYESAHALYDWIHGELGYKPEDILIVGYSLGSSVALELAQTCASRAVLLLAPFYSGWQVMMDWSSGDALDMRDRAPFPSDEMIGNVKCPVAIMHGENDETCPCVRARELYELAQNKAGFTLVPDAGHCDLLARLGSARFREIVSGLLAI